MAIISLPLHFLNSFWSQDYRRGLEVIFKKLEQGVVENDEIVEFIRARAVAEEQFAASLKSQPTSKPGKGFAADDGASLLMVFRGLQAETDQHGQLHEAVSAELHSIVAQPFQDWTEKHRAKLENAKREALNEWIGGFEEHRAQVEYLRQDYIDKSRLADEAEDDARFVSNDVADRHSSPSSSPRTPIHDIRKPPTRQPTLSERVTQRLRGLGRTAASTIADATPPAPPLQVFDAEAVNVEPRLDKGKAKATETGLAESPPSLSPPPSRLTLTITEPVSEDVSGGPVVTLNGVPFTYPNISAILTRARAEMDLRPTRFPILGTYQDTFTGDKFTLWLLQNVSELEGDREIASRAANVLTEHEDLLRRVGQFGNQFEDSSDAYYQFRPEAFTLGQPPSAQAETKSPLGVSPLQRLPDLAKTSGTFVDIVSKALGTHVEPPFIRCRREAKLAEDEYRKDVRSLDRHRLSLEQKIEKTLGDLQVWESGRLHAVKDVLLQYQGSIANLRKSYDASAERSSTLISSYDPRSDLTALIERYRTGPFRPKAFVFESITHEEADVVFGIDLRKWAEGGWGSDEVRRDTLPPVLTTLLDRLKASYDGLPNDLERRRTWIYEVPMKLIHPLRETVNSIPDGQLLESSLAKYDPPVLAGAVKLWLLELEPPLGLYDAWDEFRKIYPSIGSSTNVEQSKSERFEAVTAALLKFPKVHLLVLNAVISHLILLIGKTKDTEEESNELYISKLALAFGRAILRPRVESERAVQDRHATMLFIDLIQHYNDLLLPAVEKKKRESERKIPQRKRTAMVDMRMKRSNITEGSDLKEAIIHQNTRRTGPGSRSSISTTTGPPESVRVLTAGQDNKAYVPPILRAGGGSSNTSPVPPHRPIVSPSPTSAVHTPPPPPSLQPGPGFVTPPPPPGFVPPPPPPPIHAFRDQSDGHSPTPSPDPSTRSSSPAVGGNQPGMPPRGTPGVRGPRVSARGPRTSLNLPPGKRDSYGQQPRPQTPPSPKPINRGGPMPGPRGVYKPSAHRRTGSGSGLATKKPMSPDSDAGIL